MKKALVILLMRKCAFVLRGCFKESDTTTNVITQKENNYKDVFLCDRYNVLVKINKG